MSDTTGPAATPAVAFEQDHLTDPAREALRLHVTTAYNTLVPSAPDNDARPALDALASTGAVKQALDRDMDACCQSGLWLWHDYLDESHTLSQAIETPEGSFWHGIMHRREGDFSNAKYWFRRVASHPLFDSIAAQAQDVIRGEPADKQLFALTRSGWDPYAFVDLCEAVHGDPTHEHHAIAVALQQLEWRSLFDWCARKARGQ